MLLNSSQILKPRPCCDPTRPVLGPHSRYILADSA